MAQPMTMGTKLADRIQALGYTLKDVVAGTGMTRFDLNDYLNRRRRPSPMQLARLSRFLQCEPESLIDD